MHKEVPKIPFAFSLQNPLLIQLTVLYGLPRETNTWYHHLGYARVSLCSALTAKREMITFTKVPGNRRIFSTEKELLVFYTPSSVAQVIPAHYSQHYKVHRKAIRHLLPEERCGFSLALWPHQRPGRVAANQPRAPEAGEKRHHRSCNTAPATAQPPRSRRGSVQEPAQLSNPPASPCSPVQRFC